MTFILVLTILVSISGHTLYGQWRDDVFRRAAR